MCIARHLQRNARPVCNSSSRNIHGSCISACSRKDWDHPMKSKCRMPPYQQCKQQHRDDHLHSVDLSEWHVCCQLCVDLTCNTCIAENKIQISPEMRQQLLVGTQTCCGCYLVGFPVERSRPSVGKGHWKAIILYLIVKSLWKTSPCSKQGRTLKCQGLSSCCLGPHSPA